MLLHTGDTVHKIYRVLAKLRQGGFGVLYLVRQGRTNNVLSVPRSLMCFGGGLVLNMRPVAQQQNNEWIEGRPGIPLRANHNDRIDNMPAELWLDLVRVKLPPQPYQQLTIVIENGVEQPSKREEPFITLYAATLVHEALSP